MVFLTNSILEHCASWLHLRRKNLTKDIHVASSSMLFLVFLQLRRSIYIRTVKYRVSHIETCLFCFVFNWGGIKPRRSPNKGVRPSTFMLAWVSNVSTSPDLYIEFSTEYYTHQHRISHGISNPLLESFSADGLNAFQKPSELCPWNHMIHVSKQILTRKSNSVQNLVLLYKLF